MKARLFLSLSHEEKFMVNHGDDILLVEDNANDEMLALHAIKRQRISKNVHVVRDGAEALAFMFCTGAYVDRPFKNPKVILLDLKLPLVDGIDVLRQIRSDPRTRLVPVVVFTISTEERDIIESYKLGINSYVVKPVDFEQFNEVAKQLGYYWTNGNRREIPANEASPETNSELVSS
jgi:two-component system, response regulator